MKKNILIIVLLVVFIAFGFWYNANTSNEAGYDIKSLTVKI